MSIVERLEDARVLWSAGRKEGAWISVLIAAAATSRKRYPRPMPDSEAFKSFIRDISPTLYDGRSMTEPFTVEIRFGTQADSISLGDLIYRYLRCNLIHEAEVASDHVVFSASRAVDGKLIGTLRVGSSGEPHTIPEFWVHNLALAIQDAPENADFFSEAEMNCGLGGYRE